MVEQYPHTMTFSTGAGDSVQDDSGDFQPGTAGSTISQACRAVVNGGGKLLTLADGSKSEFSHTVQMSLSSVDVPVGTDVTISTTATGALKARGIVKQFSREQMHCRLWL